MTTRDLLDTTNYKSFQGALDALYKWQVANCPNKTKVWVNDPLTSTRKQIEVPCGQCLHCRNTRLNEWYARMFLHSFHYKHVYYVTFTYASPETADTVGCDYLVRYRWGKEFKVPICVGKKYQVALNDMHRSTGTVFSRNTSNTHGALKALPGVINEKHMQNMWKKLRFLAPEGSDISYYYCSEYGHKYGHCHHHAIVWSMQPLPEHYFKQAWSRVYCELKDSQGKSLVVPFRGQKKHLVPGSRFACPFGHVDYQEITQEIAQNQGFDKNGKFVFAYVCKYLCKKEFTKVQVDDVWNSLPQACRYVRPLDEIDYDTGEVLSEGVRRPYRIELEGLRTFKGLNYDYDSFVQEVSPFTRCSTRKAIGKDYANSRIEDFKKQNFNIGKDRQGKSLVLPSYFREFTKQRLLPYRIKVTQEGKATNSVGSVKVAIAHLKAICRWNGLLRSASCSTLDFVSGVLADTYPDLGDLRRRLSFYDVTNGVRYDLDTRPTGPCAGFVYHLRKYDRHARVFKSEGFLDVADFLKVYEECVAQYKEFTDYYKKIALENQQLFECYKERLKQSGLDYGELMEKATNNIKFDEEVHQTLYHDMLHQSFEL